VVSAGVGSEPWIRHGSSQYPTLAKPKWTNSLGQATRTRNSRRVVPLRPMMAMARPIALWIGAAAAIAFGAASVVAYRPGGATDRAVAFDELKSALASLDGDELAAEARLATYRDGLTRAGGHLRSAIRENPLDTASIERLAVVRWESGVLGGDPDAGAVQSLVGIAAERAPRVPEIQADIGSLLYRMGNPAKAAPFMRRAVELSPTITSRVVTMMRDAGVEPVTIADTLPQTAELLVALRADFVASGDTDGWLESAEGLLAEHPGELMWSYMDVCLQVGAEGRLLEHVEKLGVLAERSSEAKRQIAIGRVHLARKEWKPAASAADRARILSPSDWWVLEFVGQMASAAGDPLRAENAFRDALTALAVSGGRGIERARLYRQRGQVLERLDRVDEAFDEYRRAIELSPDDPWLRRRFAESGPRSLSAARP
jgi:tetratricopeptide (TPR) repeat protein